MYRSKIQFIGSYQFPKEIKFLLCLFDINLLLSMVSTIANYFLSPVNSVPQQIVQEKSLMNECNTITMCMIMESVL